MMDKNKQFLENVRQVMDESVQDLDGATLSKLTQARNAALDRKRQTRRRFFAWGTPAAGMAVAVLVAVFMLRSGPVVPVEETFVADLDLITSEEAIEFYEDMEFYEWLSEVEGAKNNEDDISLDGSHTPALVAARSRIGARRQTSDGDTDRDTKYGDAGISRLV